jgi:VIT1/CCC1 family predicted Fe2+/Mn2+ transporter
MTNNNEYQGEIARNDGSTALTIISWLFGVIFFAIGFVNTFWGNDPGFGIFILLLSLIYILPVNAILRKLTGFSIPKMWLIKILLGLFIIWAAMGVGELFDKIEMMVNDLSR